MTEELESIIKTLPDLPGVYEMKDEEGRALYIGKAKSLKKRVKSYFQNTEAHSARIKKMVEKIDHIEWTTVSSEWEALVLESNLIKSKRPKFNVLLRDDKNFSYIRVSLQEDFPMITLSRRVIKDGSLYFGPKTSASSVRTTIDLLQAILKLRTTPLEISENLEGEVSVKNAGNIKFPCLNFHLKKCDAPCIGHISSKAYKERIHQAISFLKGNTDELESMLQEKMKKEVAEGKFELAAKTRDYIFALRDISKKQLVSAPNDFSADVVGVYAKFSHVFFHVFSIRAGKLINSETFPIPLHQKEISAEDVSETIIRFLQDYQNYSVDLPESILIDDLGEEQENLEHYFLDQLDKKLELITPQKGDKKRLLDLANANAKEYANRHAASFIKHEESLEETLVSLQKKLGLALPPKRIECYDVSHFSGEKTYASMVVFEDGKQKNKDYRIFSIKSLAHRQIDDFASLQEALSRRLTRLPVPMKEGQIWKKITRKKDFSQISEEFLVCKDVQSCFFKSDNKEEGDSLQCVPSSKNTEYFGIFENGNLLISSVLKIERGDDGAHFFFIPELDYPFSPFLTFLFPKYKKQDLWFHTNQNLENLQCEKISEMLWKRSSATLPDESFVSVPNLIVIDGGKGQLSSAFEVLQSTPYAEKISICSLAKQEEEVFMPNISDPIFLAKNSPEGHLLQRIRDEAHRFAITKNRTEREKIAQKSVLDEIKGLGPKTKKHLKEVFGSVASISAASDEELLQYISSSVLKELRKKI